MEEKVFFFSELITELNITDRSDLVQPSSILIKCQVKLGQVVYLCEIFRSLSCLDYAEFFLQHNPDMK